MAISMTGFGRGEYKDDNYQFLVECKTINHKYADINIRLPRKLSFLEDKARILVKDYIKRGRVDLYIKLDLLGSEDVNLKFDEALATQYVSILKQIKDKFDLVDDISVMNIAKFPDVIKTEEKEDDEDKLWSMLKVALENALLKLKEMRSEEGKKLAEDIQNRCDLLKNYIEDIEKYSYNVVIDYKEKEEKGGDEEGIRERENDETEVAENEEEYEKTLDTTQKNTCRYCHQRGHKERKCPLLHPELQKVPRMKPKKDVTELEIRDRVVTRENVQGRFEENLIIELNG